MSAEAPSALPRSAGALLAAERERQGLSRVDVAQRLHVSTSQIEALETGDYARLAGGPFLKGLTRNYARALELDPEPLVSLVLRDAPSGPPPRLAVPNQDIQFDPFGRRWSPAALPVAIAAAILLVVGIGVLYWWLNVYPAVPTPVAAANPSAVELPGMAPPLSGEPASSAAAAPVEAAAAADPAAAPVPPVTTAPADAPPAPPTKAARAPAPPGVQATQPAPAGLARIRLEAAARTWVEIVDGSGDRVASRHIEAGVPAEFLGRPPLRLAIGNAPGTRVSFNGREVDLAPHTRSAVARLTLE